MAEEFQASFPVCGGSWWSSPRATYGGCYQNNFMSFKTRSTDQSSGCYATAISPDSAFQTMGSSPSTTTNWYEEALLIDGRSGESAYNQTLVPEILNSSQAAGKNSSNFGMDQEQTSSYMSDSTGYPTSLLQTLFDGTSQPSQQPLCDSQANLNDFDGLHSTNKAVFWNTSGLDMNDNRAGFFSSSSPNIKSGNEDIGNFGSSVKKSCSESTFKRARIVTPSPLPTFKVRKEKLGDRVTALQQLVSPFGKTDTASVLHEAIEYIKLLHDQINVLSNPYMKNGASMQVQQINDKNEAAKQQDLRSRGLCLVPVSSTFPVATETTPEYWTSGFRSTFNH